MTCEEFAQLVISNLNYIPNDQQLQVIGVLSRFCSPTAPSDSVFLLNGYAGTGKTSLCSALVKALPMAGIKVVLLAPTGRAAKVFSQYAEIQASTIHRIIYKHTPTAPGQYTSRQTSENKYKDTMFIVDEASMITASESGDNVLEDLIHYVYTGDNCRMILIGDTAQLPPVGCTSSPAMSADILRDYGLRVTSVTLTKIARQGHESGILYNATWLRKAMRQQPIPQPHIFTDFNDVIEVSPVDVSEEIYNAYSNDGVAQTIVITRSNKRASGFNREIRASVLYFEEELEKGELLIVSKNNYLPITDKPGKIQFIANGEIVTVGKILAHETKYGLRFADVELILSDNTTTITCKILLDSLQNEDANMPQETMTRLYYSIMEDPDLFGPYTPSDVRLATLRKNPYWNALQVKYAYAITCHKAQGGQWKNVFVDMAYISPDAVGLELYRWLYTAETRATSMLYIIREDHNS